MARTGKIARLPLAIRDELNSRLRDNESGQTILEWVNGLDVTKEILTKSFAGEPISDANLSVWRQGGFAEWLHDQDDIERIHRLQEVSIRLAKASGGNLSEGLLALNVGRIQTALEQFWEGMRDIESTEDGNEKDKAVTKLLGSLTAIRGMEIEKQKLDLKRVEVEQKGESLTLEKAKFRRTTAELFIEYVANEEARRIALGAETKDNKVAQLIQLWFGEMPDNIGPAEFRQPKEAV